MPSAASGRSGRLPKLFFALLPLLGLESARVRSSGARVVVLLSRRARLELARRTGGEAPVSTRPCLRTEGSRILPPNRHGLADSWRGWDAAIRAQRRRVGADRASDSGARLDGTSPSAGARDVEWDLLDPAQWL